MGLLVYNLSCPLGSTLELEICDTFFRRLRGYMLAKEPDSLRGLLFTGNQESRLNTSIHMIGVFYALAIIWLDKSMKVVDLHLAQPWELAYIPKLPACYIIETKACRLTDFHLSDQLLIEGLKVQ